MRRQTLLLRPGQWSCQAIPAVRRRPVPPHPEPSRLEWPRDASAASLSLNSSACALGYSTFSQPSAALLSGGGSEPAHQGAGHPDARREVRLRPPAHSSAAARTLSRAAVRACVVPTASAAAHRQRPWQEPAGPSSSSVGASSSGDAVRRLGPPPPRTLARASTGGEAGWMLSSVGLVRCATCHLFHVGACSEEKPFRAAAASA